MRKNQVLIVAVALLFCSAVAVQAQGIYEVIGVPTSVREGGGAEMAGNVVLFRRTGDGGAGVVTVEFSAPLAEGTMPTMTNGTIALDDDDAMIVMVTLGGTATTNVYTLTDIRLDVTEATLPVTATVSGDGNAIVSGVAEVVNAVEHGVQLSVGKSAALLTRGGDGAKQAIVTLTETFRSAWNDDTEIVLNVSGIPKGATWGVWHVQPADAAMNDADVDGNVTITDGTNTGSLVDGDNIANGIGVPMVDGSPTTTGVPPIKADGDDITLTIVFDNTGGPGADENSLPLEFGLHTGSMNVPEGMVTITAAFGPEKAADGATNPEFFADANPTAAGTLFTYEPATCTLLFPYGLVHTPGNFDTGIAISNPSGFGSSPLNGAITFTLFMNGADAEMPMMVTTDAMTAGALNDEGMLEAGNTYTVLLSEVLAMADHTGDFTGHFYAKADFTGCRGVGWVTDFSTVNQAYLAYFGDNLDEGGVPANNTQ